MSKKSFVHIFGICLCPNHEPPVEMLWEFSSDDKISVACPECGVRILVEPIVEETIPLEDRINDLAKNLWLGK